MFCILFLVRLCCMYANLFLSTWSLLPYAGRFHSHALRRVVMACVFPSICFTSWFPRDRCMNSRVPCFYRIYGKSRYLLSSELRVRKCCRAPSERGFSIAGGRGRW
ncbi:hypothetical protein BJ322DRAFT_187250 [Thelephora terrestris]|uniref:Uncharacterized protein n=1 Tax=Thelephora terrestris TaxID=56493 RepID=A0A9P6L540_9AGAM|nr:hypothetical protein BJ322DRAFT_187250 [Thelephora terrestris]